MKPHDRKADMMTESKFCLCLNIIVQILYMADLLIPCGQLI